MQGSLLCCHLRLSAWGLQFVVLSISKDETHADSYKRLDPLQGLCNNAWCAHGLASELYQQYLQKRNGVEPELSSAWLTMLSTQLRFYHISVIKICWYKPNAFPGSSICSSLHPSKFNHAN